LYSIYIRHLNQLAQDSREFGSGARSAVGPRADRPGTARAVVAGQLKRYDAAAGRWCVMDSTVLARLATGERDCRYCLGAALALGAAVVAVTYGLLHQDVVTALGGLLFVPTAVLLAGIGLTGGDATDGPERRHAD